VDTVSTRMREAIAQAHDVSPLPESCAPRSVQHQAELHLSALREAAGLEPPERGMGEREGQCLGIGGHGAGEAKEQAAARRSRHGAQRPQGTDCHQCELAYQTEI